MTNGVRSVTVGSGELQVGQSGSRFLVGDRLSAGGRSIREGDYNGVLINVEAKPRGSFKLVVAAVRVPRRFDANLAELSAAPSPAVMLFAASAALYRDERLRGFPRRALRRASPMTGSTFQRSQSGCFRRCLVEVDVFAHASDPTRRRPRGVLAVGRLHYVGVPPICMSSGQKSS
jgi:hypothetical protein